MMPFQNAVWNLGHMGPQATLAIEPLFLPHTVSVLAQTTRPSVDMYPFWHGHKRSCIHMSWNGKFSSMIIIGDNAFSVYTSVVRQGVSRI